MLLLELQEQQQLFQQQQIGLTNDDNDNNNQRIKQNFCNEFRIYSQSAISASIYFLYTILHCTYPEIIINCHCKYNYLRLVSDAEDILILEREIFCCILEKRFRLNVKLPQYSLLLG